MCQYCSLLLDNFTLYYTANNLSQLLNANHKSEIFANRVVFTNISSLNVCYQFYIFVSTLIGAWFEVERLEPFYYEDERFLLLDTKNIRESLKELHSKKQLCIDSISIQELFYSIVIVVSESTNKWSCEQHEEPSFSPFFRLYSSDKVHTYSKQDSCK